MGFEKRRPDFVLVSPDGLFFALELKRRGETLTDEQDAFRNWSIALLAAFRTPSPSTSTRRSPRSMHGDAFTSGFHNAGPALITHTPPGSSWRQGGHGRAAPRTLAQLIRVKGGRFIAPERSPLRRVCNPTTSPRSTIKESIMRSLLLASGALLILAATPAWAGRPVTDEEGPSCRKQSPPRDVRAARWNSMTENMRLKTQSAAMGRRTN